MVKKLAKIVSLIFLSLAIYSCDSGCVSEDEFSGSSVEVESKPESTGIIGTYNAADGGQMAYWQNSNLRSNGEQFIIQITGSWTPWFGSQMDDNSLNNLKKCSFCAKKEGVANCICYDNQAPRPEISADGFNYVDTNCNLEANQNDPAKCTCTRNFGSASDYTVYHVPLNYMDKYENVKTADEQSNCKYYGGMGLYIGLFGRSGNETPRRIYHLFSQTEVCDVVRNSNGQCLDDNGKDVTKYIYKSAHNTIFVKDDLRGNNTDDDSNGTYHSPYEQVKLTINDGYYSDNFGKYTVAFYKGVGSTNTKGVLEYLVSLVEDTMLGKVNEDGRREGGIIKFMYLSIVQDSGFITIFQILLSMYIAFYGLATLAGIAEITQKELLNRLLKLGLVIFFTSSDSWNWYNDLVVQFFKDGMDSAIGMIMNLSDQNFDSQNSSIIIAQMERASDTSSATRFSYIDLTIDKLLSFAAAKKIFGLFFGTFFGFLYIPIIYLIIGYFIYVMLNAALVYALNLMKLIFILALGPVFMCFTLFAQTNGIFKKWLLFLSARSLEMVIMFLILYNFIVLINNQFTSMLYYKACVESYNLYLFSFKILKSYTNRSLLSWVSYFVTIAGLIFMLQLIFDKIAEVAGHLISVGGESNKDADNKGRGQSSFDAAGKMMGSAFNFAESAVKSGVYNGAGFMANGADFVGARVARFANAAGGKIMRTELAQAIGNSIVGKTATKIYDNLPNDPRTFYRNRIIDAEINAVKKANPSLSGVALENKIRETVIGNLQIKMMRGKNPEGKNIYDPNNMKLAGITNESILKRLDEKLVQEPLKNFIKETAAQLKTSDNAPIGNDLREAIKQAAKDWAATKLVGGVGAIEKHLQDTRAINNLIKQQSKFTTSEAAKAFGDSVEGQNRYLQHLKENEFIQQQKSEKAKKGIFFGVTHQIGRGITKIYSRDVKNNPEVAREVFLRRINKQQSIQQASQKYLSKLERTKNYNPIAKAAVNFKEYFNPRNLDLKNIRDRVTGDFVLPNYFSRQSQQVREASLNSTRFGLKNIEREKQSILTSYNKKIDPKQGFVSGFTKQNAEKEKDNSLKTLQYKKEFLTSQIKRDALLKDDFVKGLQEISKLQAKKDAESFEIAERLRQKMLLDAQESYDNAKKDVQQKENEIKSLEQQQIEKEKKLKEIEELIKTKEKDAKTEQNAQKKQEILDQIEKAKEQFNKIEAKEKQEIAQLQDQIISIGGKELVKEGLCEINGTTLVEEELRLSYIKELVEKQEIDFVQKISDIEQEIEIRKNALKQAESDLEDLESTKNRKNNRVQELQEREEFLNNSLKKLEEETSAKLSQKEKEDLQKEIEIKKQDIEVNEKLLADVKKDLQDYNQRILKKQKKIEKIGKKIEKNKNAKDIEDSKKLKISDISLDYENEDIDKRTAEEILNIQQKYDSAEFTNQRLNSELSKVSQAIDKSSTLENLAEKIDSLQQSVSVAQNMSQKISKEMSEIDEKILQAGFKLFENQSPEQLEKRKLIDEVYNLKKNHTNPFQLEEDLNNLIKKDEKYKIYAEMSEKDLENAVKEFDNRINSQKTELESLNNKKIELFENLIEQQKVANSTNIQLQVAAYQKQSLEIKKEYQENLKSLKELREKKQLIQNQELIERNWQFADIEEKKIMIADKKNLFNSLIDAEEKVYKMQKVIENDQQRSSINEEKAKINARNLDLKIIAEEQQRYANLKQKEINHLQKQRLEKDQLLQKLAKTDEDYELKSKILGEEISNINNTISKTELDFVINQKMTNISYQEIIVADSNLELLKIREKQTLQALSEEETTRAQQILANLKNQEMALEFLKIDVAAYKANMLNDITNKALDAEEELNSKAKSTVTETDLQKAEQKEKELQERLEILDKQKALMNSIESDNYGKDKGNDNKDDKSDAKEEKSNYALKSSLFSDKTHLSAKIGLASLGLSKKKIELEQLKSIKPEELTAEDLRKIANLESEINDIENKIKNYKQESQLIDSKISSLND